MHEICEHLYILTSKYRVQEFKDTLFTVLAMSGNPHMFTVLVGNKADLNEKREVDTEVHVFMLC